ncbi:MAG: DivIVA domain-containing protein [Acidimicrobiales bacterium]
MADDHPTISTSRIDAGDVARRRFSTVRRGLDPDEVRAYLELVAKALEHADRREQELLHELHDAEERARHPVIDESVLTTSLGQRSAAVLRGAHEEAARILSQAEEAAVTMVRDAQQQATDIQVNAESSAAERIAEAELEANSLRHQAREEASAVLETARVEGEAVVERAREHGRAMLDQAQEARRRVLADMAHRRRLVTEQIELFRAARDEIAASVIGVRRSLDRIVEDLSHAEDSARASAAGAARPRGPNVPEAVLVEEGERAIAQLGELDAGKTYPGPQPGHGQQERQEQQHDQEQDEQHQDEQHQDEQHQDEQHQDEQHQDEQHQELQPAALRGDLGSSQPDETASHPGVLPPEGQPRAASHAENAPSEARQRGTQEELETLAPRRVLRFDDVATVVTEPAHGPPGPVPASSSAQEPAPGPAVLDRPTASEIARRPLVHDWRDDPAEPGTAAQVGAMATTEPVSPGLSASSVATEAGAGVADVDGLFARLRARHAADPPEDAVAEDRASRADPVDADPVAAAGVDDRMARGLEAAVEGVVGEDDVEKGAESADAEMFVRRAEALDPIAMTLARRLKRALQDDQNGLLDRLRQGTGEWSDELLLDEGSQQALYVEAATPSLRDAMAAGAAFARAVAGGRQSKTLVPDAAAVHEVTEQLASTVVTLLRRRLDAGEISDAAERIGAAYREWRGERIERLAEDSAVEAFSKGVLVGAGRRSVRWSRSEVGPGCADCEDNGLAGAVAPGEEFPTGHRHPPAHAGCRCLVLPTPR